MMRKRIKVSNGVKKFSLAIIVSIVISLGITELSAEFPAGERLFLIEEKILLKDLPKDTSELRLWIPYPVSGDDFQQISDFKIEAPDAQSLNFVIYPYAEASGVQFTDIDIELTFRDLEGGNLENTKINA